MIISLLLEKREKLLRPTSCIRRTLLGLTLTDAWVCVCLYLILHHGPLLCRPAVVRVMWHCGGAAKVTQLDGALVTNQEVLNLRQESSGFACQSIHIEVPIRNHNTSSLSSSLIHHSLDQATTDLEVSVYDWRLLFVHVLHGATRLVEDFQHSVTWQGSLLLYPLYKVHQLTWGRKRHKQMNENPSVKVKVTPDTTIVGCLMKFRENTRHCR